MKHLPIKSPEVLFAGFYGSKVYGTHNEKSDTDIIIVTKAKSIDFKLNNTDYQVLALDDFKSKLYSHNIAMLETYFLDDHNIICENFGFRESLHFSVNIKTLRHSLSQTASNSFVKCKKKLTMEKDLDYVGLKSLYHSLRILMFGIDIATNNKITNYGIANDLYHQIVNEPADWEYLKEKYQPLYNKLSSEFRKVTTK